MNYCIVGNSRAKYRGTCTSSTLEVHANTQYTDTGYTGVRRGTSCTVQTYTNSTVDNGSTGSLLMVLVQRQVIYSREVGEVVNAQAQQECNVGCACYLYQLQVPVLLLL